MTVTYDEKDTAAINFARWVLSLKYLQKDYMSEDKLTLWIGDKATHPTVEELYQMYLKQL